MDLIKEVCNIEKKLEALGIAKKLIENDETKQFQLFTHNINTGIDGSATFYNDDKTIKVFEGKGDGSDDKEMDYETFVDNYTFYVAHEIEQIPMYIKI